MPSDDLLQIGSPSRFQELLEHWILSFLLLLQNVPSYLEQYYAAPVFHVESAESRR
jgi:hypothetical protein